MRAPRDRDRVYHLSCPSQDGQGVPFFSRHCDDVITEPREARSDDADVERELESLLMRADVDSRELLPAEEEIADQTDVAKRLWLGL